MNNIKPDIRFKNGVIELSAKVSILLGIENGDIIGFKQEDEELYVYLYAKSPCPSYKGKCIQVKNTGKFTRVYWKKFCDKILELDGSNEAKYRIGDPVKKGDKTYLPIITRINYAKSGN